MARPARRGRARRARPLGGARGAVRRAATTSCACSRTSTTRRRATGASGSSRSRARAASARAASPGSSSSTSTGSSRPSTGTRAAPRRTGAASRSGRWARWSASAPAWPRSTTRRRRGPGSRRRSRAGSPTSASGAGSSSRCSALLGVGDPPAGGQDQLFSAWRTLFERIAADAPVVMVFEDLQWADSGLLAFIDHLVEWSRGVPIYVVALARPELLETRPDWGAGKRNFTSLALEPLTPAAMHELLAGLVPGLPTMPRRRIVARADGVPLYAVEIVRMLVAQGSLEVAGRCLPAGRRPRRPGRPRHAALAHRGAPRCARPGRSRHAPGGGGAGPLVHRGRPGRPWPCSTPTEVERRLVGLGPARAGRPRRGPAVHRARPVRVRPVARARGRLLDAGPARSQVAPPGRRPPLRDARGPGAGGRPRDRTTWPPTATRPRARGRRPRGAGADRAPGGRRPRGRAGRPGAGARLLPRRAGGHRRSRSSGRPCWSSPASPRRPRGSHEDAERLLGEAIDLLRAAGDRSGAARVTGLLGDAMFGRYRLDAALALVEAGGGRVRRPRRRPGTGDAPRPARPVPDAPPGRLRGSDRRTPTGRSRSPSASTASTSSPTCSSRAASRS